MFSAANSQHRPDDFCSVAAPRQDTRLEKTCWASGWYSLDKDTSDSKWLCSPYDEVGGRDDRLSHVLGRMLDRSGDGRDTESVGVGGGGVTGVFFSAMYVKDWYCMYVIPV